MKTPKVLEKAVRQYRSYSSSDFIRGYDHKEATQIFNIMEGALKAQSRILTAYHEDEQPPEWVFDALNAAWKIGIKT